MNILNKSHSNCNTYSFSGYNRLIEYKFRVRYEISIRKSYIKTYPYEKRFLFLKKI